MRVLATLLLTVTLSAQVVDSNEQTYGPFEAGPRDHSFSIAVAPHGMLLAWSEADEGNLNATIHVGLLNFNAQLVSPIRTLASRNPNGHSTSPAVATDGQRFFVAWLERDPSTWQPSRVSGTLVDATGAQIGDTQDLGRATAGAPSVVWTGVDYRVFGHTQRVQFATPQANGWVDWAGARRDFCWFGCQPDQTVFNWTVITEQWIRSGGYSDFSTDNAKPAVLANGDDLLIVWAGDAGLRALPVIDGFGKKVFFTNHYLARSSRNAAAAEKLVVYERSGDIYGALLLDGAFGEPFPITEGPRWDELPRVYLVGANRYLVTYVVDRDPAGVTMAGRFVSIEP